MVERKWPGAATSARATWAPASPASARCWRRTLRADTSAISAIDRTPLTKVSSRISKSSAITDDMGCCSENKGGKVAKVQGGRRYLATLPRFSWLLVNAVHEACSNRIFQNFDYTGTTPVSSPRRK